MLIDDSVKWKSDDKEREGAAEGTVLGKVKQRCVSGNKVLYMEVTRQEGGEENGTLQAGVRVCSEGRCSRLTGFCSHRDKREWGTGKEV